MATECGICKESDPAVRAVPDTNESCVANHIFCSNCYELWMVTMNSCPTCREPVRLVARLERGRSVSDLRPVEYIPVPISDAEKYIRQIEEQIIDGNIIYDETRLTSMFAAESRQLAAEIEARFSRHRCVPARSCVFESVSRIIAATAMTRAMNTEKARAIAEAREAARGAGNLVAAETSPSALAALEADEVDKEMDEVAVPSAEEIRNDEEQEEKDSNRLALEEMANRDYESEEKEGADSDDESDATAPESDEDYQSPDATESADDYHTPDATESDAVLTPVKVPAKKSLRGRETRVLRSSTASASPSPPLLRNTRRQPPRSVTKLRQAPRK